MFALLRGFVLLIPSFILLPVWLGVAGIWLAMPLSEMFTTVVILGFYFSRRIKLKRL